MHPYKSVYWINFDMATELIAHGRQHLFGKTILLSGAETGEQGCGQNLRSNSFLDCRPHGPAALTGFLNNAREFAQCGILGQSHDCQIKKPGTDGLLARVACLCNNQARHQTCPTGLMVGTAPATRISVEIFVKQY